MSIFDVIDLALCILFDLKQRIAKPFDTAGEREIELSELAQLCATTLGQPDIRIERPPMREELADRYVGDGSAMRAARRVMALRLRRCPIRSTRPLISCARL